jgi:site-specific DNA recombinase
MSKLRYVAYLRKSTEDEERQVLSKAAQRAKIEEVFKDLNILEFVDESKSAFKPYQRPVFQQLMDKLDAGLIDGIIAWHPDRISRNEVDASAVTWRIRQGIIKDLKFASFSFDNSPEGMMMLQMTMSQSQYYSAKLSKDVRRGISQKVKMGGVTGVAPEGYMNDRINKAVLPDPVRFPLVRKAFDMFLTGEHGVQSILRTMNDEWGYTTIKRTKVGGNKLNRSTFYRMLSNPRYAGLINDPYEEGRFHKAAFKPMITMEEYDRIQSLLGNKGKPRLCASKQFALKGFIRCGECGCMITAETKKKKLASGAINQHTYYHCTKKRPCSQKGSVKENVLFEQVTGLIDSYELTPKLYEWGMQALTELAEKEVGERNSVQAMQHESITNIQDQLDNLLDLASKGFITPDEYKAKSHRLKADLANRQNEQADTANRSKNWYEFVGKTLDTLTNANEKFVMGDLADKKEILLAIGKNPVLIDGKLEITPNEWLIPIKKDVKRIRRQLDEVRTMPTRSKDTVDKHMRNTWLGMRDSNPRMPGPEPGALPLGESPTL